jgi:hypothetical protein
MAVLDGIRETPGVERRKESSKSNNIGIKESANIYPSLSSTQ